MENVKYINLDLPSGTLWAETFYPGYYSFKEAKTLFQNKLPSVVQCSELFDECNWVWDKKNIGYRVIGKNGNSIFFSASGLMLSNGQLMFPTFYGHFWTSTSSNFTTSEAMCVLFKEDFYCTLAKLKRIKLRVCLVKN